MPEYGIISDVKENGFGFIQTDTSESLFFHFNDVISDKAAIVKGARVEFVKGKGGGGGFAAKQVKISQAPLGSGQSAGSGQQPSTHGSTYGSSRGSTHGSTHGSTYGSTHGSTYGSNRGPTHGSARGSTYAAGGNISLPPGAVFNSFYGKDGRLNPNIFFEAAQDMAVCFERAGLKPTQYRQLYQQFLCFITPLRKSKAYFPEAQEKFSILYVERIERAVKRNLFNPIVKDFFDQHKKLTLSSSEEMLGFFRYLTNILCYLKS
jgi:cold shock CspA family protein